jgi:hypothetical protein
MLYIVDGTTEGSLSSSSDGINPVNITSGGSYQISLGYNNILSDSSYIFSSGTHNQILNSSNFSSICGGNDNIINIESLYSFIGGGSNNYISYTNGYASIVGGYNNYIIGGCSYSFIGGGYNNYIAGLNDGYSSIVGGYNNYIETSSNYSIICGGHNNIIHGGTTHAFIGSGVNNTIDSGGYCNSILGGYVNTINGSSEYASIGSGRNNTITNGGDCSSIGGGYLNTITNGTEYAFIGGGYDNTITNSATYSAILGGHGNYLDASTYGDNSFIIGSLINTTSYQRDNMTYMNNMFLWDRGLELKDRTGNQGDALIIESIGTNGVPIVTWGSVSGSGSYSGTDPIPDSVGSYTVASKGSSILLSSYVVVQASEDTLGNDNVMVGTIFNTTGYNFTNVNATTYASIMTDMISTSSPGLGIKDGYRYQIDIDLLTIAYGGQYISSKRPIQTLIYTPPIIFSTTNYTFGSNVGTITGNVTISDENNANYQFTTIDSIAPTTLGPYLMVAYNSTEKKINFILKDIYASSRYVYKMPAIYNSASGGSTTDITWDTSIYSIPTTSDLVTFWNTDPATNGGNPDLSIASVVGNVVTINANYGLQVNQPCWVFVKGRMPVVSVKLNYTVTKTAI